MQKRVLIITYYWPPSGGSGVQRWLKFAKYLPEAGWEPVIFTPENPDFDLKDESLLKEISPNLEVIRFPIWEPYQLFAKVKKKGESHPGRILEQQKKGILDKLAIWLRANLLVPDPRVFWVKPATQFLNELLQEGQFQAIITTGPPHSLHLIGQKLKQKHGIPWLADFRDPWSQWEFLDTLPMLPFIRRKHESLERKVLQQADVVVTISPTFQRDLEKLAGRKVDLVTNGYDPADIPKDFILLPKVANRLHLVYTGIIDAIRNPLPLMQALKAEFEVGGEEVSWSFVGKVSEQVQQQVEADSWLQAHIHFAGYVPHHQVFEFYAKADALVLILTDTKNAKGNIPGKLFEYLATGLPVLALGDPQGDSSGILSQAGAGAVLGHGDLKGMQAKLRELYESAGTQQTLGSLEAFSRKTGSKQVATLLDRIASVESQEPRTKRLD
jgi:glycosyltransferase involved in cell wall biosynthesis